jgi:DNA (cytosine-5)-methyltransferase 1
VIHAVDLFAGAGGASEGLFEAATARGVVVKLTAVNHWPTAVATHTENHPDAKHFCMRIDALDPRVAVPGRKLDILVAAPECTHHSTARGGKPINDQSRAGAWQVLHWLDHIRVEHVLIENVPEFRTWGPLSTKNRPIKSKKGDTFRAFIYALEQKGYTVEYKVLNAADYGAATTRRRLFIQASRGKKPIYWPEQTHSKAGGRTLLGETKKWRAAREIIDWQIQGESIFKRKKALAPATMRRIMEGLRRFSPQLEPFLVVLRNHMDGKPLTEPVPTIAAEGQHIGLAQPFVMPVTHGADGSRRARSDEEPLPAVTGANRGELALVESMILPQGGGGVLRPTSQPVPTVHGDGIGLVQPFIFANRTNNAPKSLDVPVPPLCTAEHIALVDPFLVAMEHGGRVIDIQTPVPTITTAKGGAFGVAEPFLSEYYGNGGARPVSEPVPTLTTKDRLALVQPVVNGYVLDIRFRMLKPHELAAAMSFPKGYKFTGNKGEQVKQIGNAWDVSMGRALFGAILDGIKPQSKNVEKIA